MNSTLSCSEETDSLTGSELSEFSDDAGPAWQEEVSKDGELFYVEEQDGVRIGLAKKKDARPHESALHGTTEKNVDIAQRNGHFRPIERQESPRFSSQYGEGPYVHSRSDVSISSKDTYRQRIRQAEDIKRNGRLAHSFRLHSEQIVTDLRNVYISVRAASSYGTKESSSLLPAMLGMMSLNSRNGGQYFHTTSHDNQVMVSAILRTGPLADSDIGIGDILLAINDVAIYQSNVEEVLCRVPHDMDIKLTFQCMKHRLRNNSDGYDENAPHEGQVEASLVQLLKPANTESASTVQLDHHVVLYLTLNINSETARGEEDILYCYPSTDNPTTRKLKSVRGIFTTLADVSQDAFKSKVLSSTLLVDEELVHCTYYHLGSEVLVICVPATCYPLAWLHKIVANTVRLLNTMHGSLTKAFHSENSSRLNHLFHLLFTNNGWSGTGSQAQKMASQSTVGTPSLTLDEDITIDIDAALTELEAADFDDGFHSQGLTRRTYVIIGSCIFYKGYLLASHLPDEDLKDISLFCQSYCLLGQLRVGQLVIWRQVYPTRSKSVPDKGGYKEVSGKHFYLIVGLGHSLLCVLLEAGGCSAPTPGKLGPDPLYVNRARATILHLDSIDMPSILNDLLVREETPTLSNADTMAKKPPSSLFGGSGAAKPPSGSSQPADAPTAAQGSSRISFFSSRTPKQGSDGASGQQTGNNPASSQAKPSGSPGLMQRLGSRKSQGSHSSVESTGSLAKSLRGLTAGISSGDVRGAGGHGDRVEMKKLTAGINNTLFHYLHLDKKSGMLLTPCSQAGDLHGVSFHRTIVENFHLCVLTLHEHLALVSDKNPERNIHEEGVLFHCKSSAHSEASKKATPHVQYWVIGRSVKVPKRREFYVCFHDSAQQDMVELAFRMGFGM